MVAKNYQLIELIKPASLASAGDRLYFTDQPQLRTLQNRAVQITSITAYPLNAVTKSPSGNPVCPLVDFKNAFLVLNVGSIDKYLNIPLAELNVVVPTQATDAPAVREVFTLNKTILVDWTKSYLQFGDAPGNTLMSYLFGVRYYILPADIRNTEYQTV